MRQYPSNQLHLLTGTPAIWPSYASTAFHRLHTSLLDLDIDIIGWAEISWVGRTGAAIEISERAVTRISGSEEWEGC